MWTLSPRSTHGWQSPQGPRPQLDREVYRMRRCMNPIPFHKASQATGVPAE